MRYLRSSLYMDPIGPPLTTVVSEADAVDSLEGIREQLHVPGGLVVQEIFESERDLVGATAEAHKRQLANAEQEGHQALLYYWTAEQWVRVREGGVLMMDKPTPLSREEICVVFGQLAHHPDHRNITIVSHTRDGEPVSMVNGRIKEDR